MGVLGKAHQQAIKDLSRAAEKGSVLCMCVAVDEEEGLSLGFQMSRWHLGGEPGTLGFTAEPSGGVVGISETPKKEGAHLISQGYHHSLDLPTESHWCIMYVIGDINILSYTTDLAIKLHFLDFACTENHRMITEAIVYYSTFQYFGLIWYKY